MATLQAPEDATNDRSLRGLAALPATQRLADAMGIWLSVTPLY
jgi:hypothetical protein